MTAPVAALDADVVVLGGGPAGAWAAITAAECGASVVLADKGRCGASGATAAANTAVIDTAPGGAARKKVIERRLERGLGLTREDWIERMLNEAHGKLADVARWGYAFPNDDRGEPFRGSLRGPDYMQVLRRHLLKLGVKLLDHSPAQRLLISEGQVAGASGLSRRGGEWSARAGAVVIATGGCAFMSKALGTFGLTGDGLLMAAEAGAVMSGMEFSGQYGVSQIDATVTKNLIYDYATFTDATGRELVGDDVFELVARNLPFGPVYAIIDRATPAVQEGLRRGQPNIFLPLDRQGVDPFRQRFAVTLRYEGTVRGVGGLAIDADGATTVAGLYAAGDAASREAIVGAVSGGGGPNSTWAIASGVWAGRAAAAHASRLGNRWREHPVQSARPSPETAWTPQETAASIALVQEEMLPLERSFARHSATMRRSLDRLDSVWRAPRTSAGANFDARARIRAREAAAMLATARWILASALRRRETRGIHRRRDFPLIGPAPPERIEVRGLARLLVERAQ